MILKRIISTILVSIVFLSSISCTEIEIFKIEGDTFSYQDKTILLDLDIESLCKEIDIEYETESMPGFIGYYFNDYRLNFYVPEGSTKIASVMFQFYDTKNDFDFNLFIDDFQISTNTNWNSLISNLTKRSIVFKIDKDNTTKSLFIENHRITSITYYVNDLNKPFRLQFR